MVKGIHGWKLTKNRNAPSVFVKSFPGATVEDMVSYSVSAIKVN